MSTYSLYLLKKSVYLSMILLSSCNLNDQQNRVNTTTERIDSSPAKKDSVKIAMGHKLDSDKHIYAFIKDFSIKDFYHSRKTLIEDSQEQQYIVSEIKKYGDLPVPLHLRNAPTALMKKLDYGKDYKYAHQYENNFINLEYLPEQISGTKLYDPGNNAREAELRVLLKKLWGEK